MVRQIPLKAYTDNYTYSIFLLSKVNHHSSWSSSFICSNNKNVDDTSSVESTKDNVGDASSEQPEEDNIDRRDRVLSDTIGRLPSLTLLDTLSVILDLNKITKKVKTQTIK
jgi:hypothetical protein